MSILGSILSVSQETINHRQLVVELYDSGDLHKAVGEDFEPITDDYFPTEPTSPTKSSLLSRLGPGSSNEERRLSKRRRSRSPVSHEYVVNDSDDDSAWNAADEAARRRMSDTEEENGRYGVESANKRRRKEPRSGEFIWVSDDSEEEPVADKGISISGASKRAENGRGKNLEPAERDRTNRRREYWKSKGSTTGDNEED
ncbi:hypothetical protein B0J17DRAFT_187830 [Rhizoctonia solani]|nr:hypothetical protein B0J17DRAFT_187830 [Rhizoctonia solani]